MRVIKIVRYGMNSPEESYRAVLDSPFDELARSESAIPRVRVPIEVRPPVSHPRLIVGVTKPDGESAELRASITGPIGGKAALTFHVMDDPLPLGSDIELLRYEI